MALFLKIGPVFVHFFLRFLAVGSKARKLFYEKKTKKIARNFRSVSLQRLFEHEPSLKSITNYIYSESR